MALAHADGSVFVVLWRCGAGRSPPHVSLAGKDIGVCTQRQTAQVAAAGLSCGGGKSIADVSKGPSPPGANLGKRSTPLPGTAPCTWMSPLCDTLPPRTPPFTNRSGNNHTTDKPDIYNMNYPIFPWVFPFGLVYIIIIWSVCSCLVDKWKKRLVTRVRPKP